MANSLTKPDVRRTLDRLFAAADDGDDTELARLFGEYGERIAAIAPGERAELFGSLYIPVSPETGELLYSLVRAARPETVVEFGTSFGIGTIHLAAGIFDNGGGRVVTTELNPVKAQRATDNLAEAGLAGVVDVVTGDALATLSGLAGPVGLVLLDGWKELYLDMLHVLEPALVPGSLVVADDTVRFAADLEGYLGYVRDPGHGYASVALPMGDGVEVSCRT